MEARGANVYYLGFDPFFGENLRQGLENRRFPSTFLGAFCAEGLEGVLLEAQATRFIQLELSDLEGASPKIDCEK
jgi:hypothetical protein